MATIGKGISLGVAEQVTNVKLHNLVDLATISGITSSDITGGTIVRGDGSVNPTNLLSNGDFESWSAGISVAPDGWANGGLAAIAQEASIIKLGTYSIKATSPASGGSYLQQRIDVPKGYTYWRNRTVTFGCWVYATVGSRVRLQIYDGSQSESTNHTGDSTWQFLTITRTMSNSITSLYCFLYIAGDGTTSAYFDGAMLVEGSSAFAFSDSPLDNWGTNLLATNASIPNVNSGSFIKLYFSTYGSIASISNAKLGKPFTLMAGQASFPAIIDTGSFLLSGNWMAAKAGDNLTLVWDGTNFIEVGRTSV